MVSRKQNIRNKKIVTLIFVEGDADELIINRLLAYYRGNGWCQQGDMKVVNTNGFPSESKMKSKLAQIKQRYTQIIFNAVFCEYDTDIFEKGIQERPNWKKVEDNLKRQYDIAHFGRIEAKTSIEDWMLDDLDGLLSALGLSKDTKLKGTLSRHPAIPLHRHINEVVHQEVGLGTEHFAVVRFWKVVVEGNLDKAQHPLSGLLVFVPIHDHHIVFLF